MRKLRRSIYFVKLSTDIDEIINVLSRSHPPQRLNHHHRHHHHHVACPVDVAVTRAPSVPVDFVLDDRQQLPDQC